MKLALTILIVEGSSTKHPFVAIPAMVAEDLEARRESIT